MFMCCHISLTEIMVWLGLTIYMEMANDGEYAPIRCRSILDISMRWLWLSALLFQDTRAYCLYNRSIVYGPQKPGTISDSLMILMPRYRDLSAI